MNPSQKNYKENYLRAVFVFFLCLFARLLPLRAPNVEPILAATMPIAKVYGALMSFSFAAGSILLYDVVTGTLGVQTFFTTLAYGIVGLWSYSYFKKRQGTRGDYVRFAILGTLFFDAVTGLSVGPIFFHQSFFQAFIGQIPFTALHLSGNVAFAFVLSPGIYHFMIKKRKRNAIPITNVLHPKTI